MSEDREHLEMRVTELESEVDDLELERDDAKRKLEALVRAIDDADDMYELLQRAPEIVGPGPVGVYWPSWTHP